MVKKSIINLIFALSFFPFFKFLPWISGDVQPLAGLIAMVAIVLLKIKTDKITGIAILFAIILFSYSLISIGREIEIFKVALLFIAYLVPISIFLILRENMSLVSIRIYYFILFIYLITGILQSLGSLVWAEPFLRNLVSNMKGSSFEGMRGVSFWASEPSYGGFMVALSFFTAVFFRTIKKINRIQFAIILFVILILCILNKSAALISIPLFICIYYFLRFFFFYSLGEKFRTLVFVTPFFLACIVSLFILIMSKMSDIKLFWLIGIIVETVRGGLINYEILASIGGKRFLTIIVGYLSLFENWGMGHGISSYLIDFRDISDKIGIDWKNLSVLHPAERLETTAFKPDSYAASIAMDTGFIGIILIALIFFLTYRYINFNLGNKSLRGSDFKSVAYSLLFVSSIMILFFSTTTIPVPWVMIAYVYAIGRACRQGINKSYVNE